MIKFISPSGHLTFAAAALAKAALMFLKTFQKFCSIHQSIHGLTWKQPITDLHTTNSKSSLSVALYNRRDSHYFLAVENSEQKGVYTAATRLTFESFPLSLVALADQLWLHLLKRTLIKIIKLSISILETDSMHTCHFQLSFSVDRIQWTYSWTYRWSTPAQFCTSWCSEMLQYSIWK